MMIDISWKTMQCPYCGETLYNEDVMVGFVPKEDNEPVWHTSIESATYAKDCIKCEKTWVFTYYQNEIVNFDDKIFKEVQI